MAVPPPLHRSFHQGLIEVWLVPGDVDSDLPVMADLVHHPRLTVLIAEEGVDSRPAPAMTRWPLRRVKINVDWCDTLAPALDAGAPCRWHHIRACAKPASVPN